MSLLAPLYALGILAVAAPVILHLIRRTPRGEVPFSSLMFLAPSPPRVTRRSRLDQRLLLLLRGAALVLLALAFARPFLRRAARLDFGQLDRRRIAVLVDVSASMRRGDLWTKAQARARDAIDECHPGDQLAVVAFDATTTSLLGFAESASLDPARRRELGHARIDRLAPGWGATDLGRALADAVAAIQDVADASEKSGRMPRRIILVGDLQRGSRLDALGHLEWPSDVELDLRPVGDDGSNAGVQALGDVADAERPGTAPGLRVRVTNDAASRRESFTLRWDGGDAGRDAGPPIDVYVPPGESRVVRVPYPAGRAPRRRLVLAGDTHPFDNVLYLADPRPAEATVLYAGGDAADDPSGLLYYLGRVFADTPGRTVRVDRGLPSSALAGTPTRTVPMVVAAEGLQRADAVRLRSYLEEGGTVLFVLTGPGRVDGLAALAGVPPWEVPEAPSGRDVMLGEISFDHPLFAPLAGPQFNDFTKIRFWKHRKVDPHALGDARVLARFEGGDPAVLEKPIGAGRLVVLASGWNPADSQVARSSKFVPLMSALLERSAPAPADARRFRVGDRVPVPDDVRDREGLVVRKPDGSSAPLEPGGASFAATVEPGVYSLRTPAGEYKFAVNLDPSESRTAPLPVETLEQLGCRLAKPGRAEAEAERRRQMQNAELEGRQKIWRWLIAAALVILIAETWAAGRVGRRRPAQVEAPAP